MSALLRGDRRRYVGVAEFAAQTGMRPCTVREWCERGWLRTRMTKDGVPVHVPGSRWDIVASEVERVREERAGS